MSKTNIVTYPVVLAANAAEGYTAIFPDVTAATTSGDSLGESLVNATTALGHTLRNRQDDLPTASTMTELAHRYPTDFIQFVAVDLSNVVDPVLTGNELRSLA